MKHYASTAFSATRLSKEIYGSRDLSFSGKLAHPVTTLHYLRLENRSERAFLRKSILMNEENWFAFRARRWKLETAGYSSIDKKVRHSSYQEIIKMGSRIIPLILEELEREVNHWFPALKVLAGMSPVPIDDRGNIAKMREVWLEWGRENNYLAR